ncbi:MAG: hypothetical protein R3B70_11415 [Polyangiaceae bacterium]
MATGTTVVYRIWPPRGQRRIRGGSTASEPRRTKTAATWKLRTGNILLGVGGGSWVSLRSPVSSGGVMVGGGGGAGFAGLFVLTAGAVLGLGGIACLIAGGIIRARA